MCWSWEVSLCFVIFQAISLTYLWRRNKYIDRWYVMVCLPFAGQETCQFFEWAWGDIEKATSNECTEFNRFWSKMLILCAYSIPLVVSIFSFMTSQYDKLKDKKIYYLWKWSLILNCNLCPILSMLMMIDNECITVGPFGHQNWPPLLTPEIITPEGLNLFLIGLYYYPSICLAAVFYKPLWIAWLPAIYSIISIVLMRALLGEEGWSVWCWSCACITLWVFVYVPISNWIINKHKHSAAINGDFELMDKLFGDNCCAKIFFGRTKEHFIRFGMIQETLNRESKEDIEL